MPRHDDGCCRNSSGNEDIAVGGAQVDVGLARSGIALDDGFKVKTRLLECLDHLVTDLKALLANAGAHSGLDAVGTRAHAAHLLDSRPCDASHGAPPSGMHGRDDTCHVVDEDDGHTVGRVDADNHTVECRYQRIHALEGNLLPVDVKGAEMLIDDRHTARMGLARHDQVIEVHTQLHGQRDARIQYAQGIVTDIVTQVHARIGIAPVHLAACGREGLDTVHGAHKIQFLQLHHVDKGSIFYLFRPQKWEKNSTFAL